MGGFCANEFPITPGKADIEITHDSVMVTSSNFVQETSVPQNKMLGRPMKPMMEVECLFPNKFHANKPLMTPSKADTVSERS